MINDPDSFPRSLCIVDSDADFVAFLAPYLEAQGCTSALFGSAEEMMKAGPFATYDFFVIALELPGHDGVDLIALVRAGSNVGILAISSRLGPDAFNSALTAGADMFIAKPARFDQMYYAIKSIWRRTLATAAQPSRAWQISADASQLHAPDGGVFRLTRTEVRIIECLRAAGGKLVSRADLAAASEVTESADNRNLDAAISRLRRKIERGTNLTSPFRAAQGFGYLLTMEITEI